MSMKRVSPIRATVKIQVKMAVDECGDDEDDGG